MATRSPMVVRGCDVAGVIAGGSVRLCDSVKQALALFATLRAGQADDAAPDDQDLPTHDDDSFADA